MNRVKFKIQKPIAFLFVIILLTSYETKAQDTICLNLENAIIVAKILEVNSTNLKYKNYSNLDGPTYTIEKDKIKKVVYKNGTVETYASVNNSHENIDRQVSDKLMAGSRVFLEYSQTDGEKNVNGDDAVNMLKDYIKGKTRCVVVESMDEADFAINLYVIKKGGGARRSMITIQHILTDKEIYKTKWVRGSTTVYYGMSGTRASIGKIVKKYLLKKYPKIKI